MRLSDLEDFVVFAKYMNVTRAAAELHMTQSNLSKRIKQIESEVGCALVTHDEGAIGLTAAGSMFLDKVRGLLADYARIVEKTRHIAESESGTLVVRAPTWPDRASACAIGLLNRLKRDHSGIAVKFVRKQYQHPLDMVKQGAVDAHIMYEYGEPDEIAARYRKQGFGAVFLCRDRLGAFCERGHPLAGRDAVPVQNLRDAGIMQITQLYRPLEKAIADMCISYGFEPRFVDRTMNSFEEMLMVDASRAIHVFPYSVKDDIQITSMEDHCLVPIESERNLIALLVFDAESDRAATRMLRLLAEERQRNGCAD